MNAKEIQVDVNTHVRTQLVATSVPVTMGIHYMLIFMVALKVCLKLNYCQHFGLPQKLNKVCSGVLSYIKWTKIFYFRKRKISFFYF